MKLNHLGTINPDGSITLHDKNIKYREAMSGEYRRIRQTGEQQVYLASLGYQSTPSSFISAIGVFNDNLRIRFHNSSVYEYYGFADRFDSMMRSISKGQYFNKHIRPTKRYAKISNIEFPSGTPTNPMADMSDKELFQRLEIDYIEKITKMLGNKKLDYDLVENNGIKYHKFIIGGMEIFRPISL